MLTGFLGPLVVLFLLFVAVLAVFTPIFIWRMDSNVKRIRDIMETTAKQTTKTAN